MLQHVPGTSPQPKVDAPACFGRSSSSCYAIAPDTRPTHTKPVPCTFYVDVCHPERDSAGLDQQRRHAACRRHCVLHDLFLDPADRHHGEHRRAGFRPRNGRMATRGRGQKQAGQPAAAFVEDIILGPADAMSGRTGHRRRHPRVDLRSIVGHPPVAGLPGGHVGHSAAHRQSASQYLRRRAVTAGFGRRRAADRFRRRRVAGDQHAVVGWIAGSRGHGCAMAGPVRADPAAAWASPLLYWVLFTLAFKLLPRATIRWRDVLPGAVLTALLYWLGNFLIGQYLARSLFASVYGAASR